MLLLRTYRSKRKWASVLFVGLFLSDCFTLSTPLVCTTSESSATIEIFCALLHYDIVHGVSLQSKCPSVLWLTQCACAISAKYSFVSLTDQQIWWWQGSSQVRLSTTQDAGRMRAVSEEVILFDLSRTKMFGDYEFGESLGQTERKKDCWKIVHIWLVHVNILETGQT